eukprot:6247059-Amphidinium_carterae.1
MPCVESLRRGPRDSSISSSANSQPTGPRRECFSLLPAACSIVLFGRKQVTAMDKAGCLRTGVA